MKKLIASVLIALASLCSNASVTSQFTLASTLNGAEENPVLKQKLSGLEALLLDLSDYKAKFPAKNITDSIIDLLKQHKENFLQNKDEISYFFVTFESQDGVSSITEVIPLNLKDNILTASIYKDGLIFSFYGNLSLENKSITLDMAMKQLKLEGFIESEQQGKSDNEPVFNRKEINTSLRLSLNESSGVIIAAFNSESFSTKNGEEVRLKKSNGYGIFVIYPNS